MPAAAARKQSQTLITISELALYIHRQTGLSVDYEALRQRITRAIKAGRLPARIVEAHQPQQGRVVRKAVLEELDAWCEWFARNA